MDIDNINATIADMEIFAPIDGTVTSIFFKEGDQTNGFEPVIEIADLNNLEGMASPVGEDFTGLAVNSVVKVQSTRNPDKVLDGVITSLPVVISDNSTSNPNSDDFIHIAINENLLSAGYQYGDQMQITAVLKAGKMRYGFLLPQSPLILGKVW